MAARLLHASQLRLDAPLVGLRDIDDGVRSNLRDATIDTFAGVLDLALEHRVNAVVFTGDLFAGPEHGVRAQLAFSAGVERLVDNGIAVVAVAGPNDSADPWFPAVTSWPDGAAIVPYGGNETIRLRHRGSPLLTIHAIAAGSDATDAPAPADHPQIVALGEAPKGDTNWGEIPHLIHGGSTISSCKRVGGTLVTTPGTAQHLGFDEAPRDDKGADGLGLVELVKIDDHVSEPERFAVGSVRMVRLTIDVDPLIDLDSLRAELESQADALVEHDDGRTIVVSAILRGHGRTHGDLLDSPFRRHELLDTLRSRSRSVAPLLWWASLDPLVDVAHNPGRTDRADFAAIVGRLGSDLANPSKASQRDGWLRAFPSDLRNLATTDDASDVRWAEARRIVEHTLSVVDRDRR